MSRRICNKELKPENKGVRKYGKILPLLRSAYVQLLSVRGETALRFYKEEPDRRNNVYAVFRDILRLIFLEKDLKLIWCQVTGVCGGCLVASKRHRSIKARRIKSLEPILAKPAEGRFFEGTPGALGKAPLPDKIESLRESLLFYKKFRRSFRLPILI